MVFDLWLVDFEPLCEFLSQGLLLVIVMMINGSEKRNCEGGFWASQFACFWKAQWPAPTENILQWFTQENHQHDNTHCLNYKSYFPFTHKRDFHTHDQTRTWVYLKASLVPTNCKPIPFQFIHQFLNIFVLFLLILLGYKSQNFCATSPYTLDISEQNRSRSYFEQNPTLIFQIFFIDFIPRLQTLKFRWGKNTEDSD